MKIAINLSELDGILIIRTSSGKYSNVRKILLADVKKKVDLIVGETVTDFLKVNLRSICTSAVMSGHENEVYFLE